MADPVLDRLSVEMDLQIARVDFTDRRNQALIQRLDVTATPTIWGFVRGVPVRPPMVGFLGEERYREVFQRFKEFAARRQGAGRQEALEVPGELPSSESGATRQE